MKTSPDPVTEPSDAELVHRTRSGDTEAFGMLWTRHYRSGMTVARSVTSRVEPEDLVQEAYARILQAIRKGGGPNGAFRAYLFTSIRNTAAVWGRAPRENTLDDAEILPDPETTAQSADDALDRSLTAQAFRSLPSRWQEVLWYTEIEQMKPAQAGVLLGMSAGAVSQLAFRAREGLREAWIQAHLRSVEDGSECQWAIASMGAYARGNLSARDRKRMDAHFQECARCMIVAAEADDVSRRLALVLLPLVLGVAGAGTYLATLQSGGAPAIAVAAMPPGLIESVQAAPAMPAAAAAPVGGVAAGAGAGAPTTGGAISGIGVLVGAGTAALAIAGAVAAATVLPGILQAPTAASLAQASASSSLSIEADVAADDDIERTIAAPELPVPDDESEATAPAPTPQPTPAPPVVPSSPAEQPSGAERPTPAPTPPPVVPDPDPDPDPEEPVAPEEPETPEEPGMPEEPTDPGETPAEPGEEPVPGEGESGGQIPVEPNPGTGEPGGGSDPGDTPNIGTGEPGTEEPGTEEPGTEEPITEEPEPEAPEPVTPTTPEPEAPTTSIAWGTPTVSLGNDVITRITVLISGTPGARVDGWIGSSGGGGSTTLDADGRGTIELRPTAVEIIRGSTVTFRYAGDEGVSTSTTVHAFLAAAVL